MLRVIETRPHENVRTHPYHQSMYPQDEYPRVTQVLQSVGLIDYGPYAHRAEALDRGAQAHAAIAYDLRGELDEDSARDAGVWGYVVAARAALDALGITRADCDLIEHSRVHDSLRYRGTIDLVSRDLIVDWKTGKAEFWVRRNQSADSRGTSPRHPHRRQ